ncbi:MAG: hypothetical protein ABS24_01355 [SAR92 bacterium BACL26 MAG-121220-bin70]|uniref:Uncharacterized protein n=1 Tax=SAR92 bacterium BACL26 MAG-121220-bin70 TaxID=1655626 RepID=A0A0R2U7C3_9GAMM|nr:MAG: hypothetical protein ABS24_01355 [SAR92 bacterium BACL26 MAG-121220-bin70]
MSAADAKLYWNIYLKRSAKSTTKRLFKTHFARRSITKLNDGLHHFTDLKLALQRLQDRNHSLKANALKVP